MQFQVLFHSPPGVLFTFPSRYLFTIGHRVVLSLRRWASQIRTGFHVTRTTWEHIQKDRLFSITRLSLSLAPLIQRYSPKSRFCNLPRDPYGPEDTSHNPVRTTDTAYHVRTVWAIPLSLATTHGVAFCFLFLELLRCFNSLGWLRQPMYSTADRQGLPDGVSPFGDPRVCLLPANRGLSQVATSFIASRCQGIHCTPLLAWPKPFISRAPPCGKTRDDIE